jgi:hypothetical protein
MFRLIPILLVLLNLSCSTPTIQKELASATTVVLQFYSANGELLKKVETAEPNAISRLARFAVATEETNKHCPVEGFISFSLPGKEARIIGFALEGCRQFALDQQGMKGTFKMSDEAADFLLALRNGENVY